MGADQPRRLTRREFLRSAAVLAAAGAWSSCRPAGAREIPGELLGPSRALGHRLRESGFPAPSSSERVPVVIVGGGIAGLSAGWRLLRSGVPEFVLLELEPRPGGNSAWGENEVSPYPWGAHYLPVPGEDARAVRALLAELGVLKNGAFEERHLCHAPEERLFIHGRWQEGLFPELGSTPAEGAQRRRFEAAMARLRARRGADGRKAFAIPMELSSRDPELLALDRLSMARWLAREGFDSPRLRWYVEYGCRDDYGASLEQTSAWAGIHYFAARGADERLLVWPEGNGWLARRLAEALGPRVRSGSLAYEVAPDGDGARVDYLDAASGTARRLLARRVIVCAPRYAARRFVAPWRAERAPLAYAPWMTANLTVEDPPAGSGAPPAWDNVIYKAEGLGYVNARHQELTLDRRRTVWTYYRALIGDADEQRRLAYGRSLADWRELCLSELERAHPGLRRHVARLDAWVWGHGMIMPRPGFVWGPDRIAMARPSGPIHYAHSDASGFSIFEEANYRGVAAAEAVMRELGRPHSSVL